MCTVISTDNCGCASGGVSAGGILATLGLAAFVGLTFEAFPYIWPVWLLALIVGAIVAYPRPRRLAARVLRWCWRRWRTRRTARTTAVAVAGELPGERYRAQLYLSGPDGQRLLGTAELPGSWPDQATAEREVISRYVELYGVPAGELACRASRIS